MKYSTAIYFALIVLWSTVSNVVHAESLLDIYDLALKNDVQFQRNNAALRATQADAGILRSALLPQINAQVIRNDQSGRQSTRSPLSALYGSSANQTTKFDTESENTVYAITLNQSIFSLPAIHNAKRATNIHKRAIALLKAEEQALMLRITNTYFEVLRNEETLATLHKIENAIKKQHQLISRRFKAGLVDATDFLETQANYHISHANRLLQEEARYNAHQNLHLITGGNSEHLWPLRDEFPIVPPTPKSADDWIANAVQNNYRLRGAFLAMVAAKNNAAAKRGAHAPTLSLSLTQQENEVDSRSFNTDSYNLTDDRTISLQLDIPIYVGGRIHAERRRAHQEYLQAQADYHATKRDIVMKIRTLHHKILTEIKRTDALKKAGDSARRSLASIRNGYETGIREIIDVLNAERNFYQRQNEYQQTRINYLVNSLELKALTGILFNQDLRLINQRLSASDHEHYPHTLKK